MSRQPIRLDLLERGRRPGRAAWMLALVAALFATDLATRVLRIQAAVGASELAMAEARRGAGKALSLPVGADPEDQAFARETLRRLSMPWDELFLALEKAQGSPVMLTAIEPDAATRRLSVSGEAKDYLGALSYVADLERQRGLEDVRLLRHELRNGAVAFTVQASWRDVK